MQLDIRSKTIYGSAILAAVVIISTIYVMWTPTAPAKYNPINSDLNFKVTGIEALDLNSDAIKVIVSNQSQIPLLAANNDYAYDGFMQTDNGTGLDIIFTIYDKTNSSLTKIPNIRHGPEFIKILDDFIIYVNSDKLLGVYARK